MPQNRRTTDPVQPRAKATRDTVVAAALHVLATGGYDGLVTNRVAESAHVSIGTVYRYFTGKDELLIELRDRTVADVSDRLSQAITDAIAMPAAVGMRHIIGKLVSAIEDHRVVIGTLINEVPFGVHSNPLPEIEQGLAHIGRAYLYSRRPGQDPSIVEAELFLAIGGLLSGCLRIALERPVTVDRATAIDLFADTLTEGLSIERPRPAPPPFDD